MCLQVFFGSLSHASTCSLPTAVWYRGENIMLQNQRDMLCSRWCSQFMPIMLQKYAIMLLSKIIFRDWLTAILPLRHRLERLAVWKASMKYYVRLSTGPARTLGDIFSRVFNIFSIAQVSGKSCARSWAIRQATSTTTGLVAFVHFFLLSYVDMCSMHRAKKKNRIMPA